MKTTSTKKESDKILGIRSTKTGDTWADMPEGVIAEKGKGEMPDCQMCHKKHKFDSKEGGKDSVEVAGKKVDCVVIETTAYDCEGKQMSQSKMWYNKDVPGNLVKSSSKMTMGGNTTESTMTCTAFEKK